METNTKEKYVVRGELALLIVVIINSLGVVLMLHSGSGISAISSVPYAFAKVLPFLTLGTCCLLYTSDAADDLLCVDLGGRHILQPK